MKATAATLMVLAMVTPLLAQFTDVTINAGAMIVIAPMVVGLFWLLIKSKDTAAEASKNASTAAAVLAEVTHKREVDSRDSRILEMSHELDAYRGIATVATDAATLAINKLRANEGKPPLPIVPDVIPEHASPVTPVQEAAGKLATLRASTAVIVSELGMEPRTINTKEEKSDSTVAAEETAASKGAATKDAAAVKEGKSGNTNAEKAATTKAVTEAIAEVSKPILQAVWDTGEDTNKRVKALEEKKTEEEINADPDTVTAPKPPEGWTK